MRFSLAGPRAAVALLLITLGQGERPATATEGPPRSAPHAARLLRSESQTPVAAVERATATEPAPRVEGKAAPEHLEKTQPGSDPDGAWPGDLEATNRPEKHSTLTPMEAAQATRHLANAWQSAQGEPPSDGTLAILCAHWAHETDRGRRMHAYNFGGIKGTGPSGEGVAIWTREAVGGPRLVRRTFRAYETADEGARDYVTLLSERYSAAFRAARERSVERFVSALGARGYFTDDERTYLRSVARLARECEREMRRSAEPRAP